MDAEQLGLSGWANKTLGIEKDDEFPAIPPGAEAVTVEQLLADPDLPPAVREWLETYAAQGEAFAVANNPPGFVTDEGCWEKAKSAAAHAGASDMYAFATWWYQEHC